MQSPLLQARRLDRCAIIVCLLGAVIALALSVIGGALIWSLALSLWALASLLRSDYPAFTVGCAGAAAFLGMAIGIAA